MHSHTLKSVGGTLDQMCDRGDCGKTFEKHSQLLRHLNIHDNNLKNCYFCPWKTPVATTSHLENHLKQHFGQADFTCHICDRSFFLKNLLDYHFEAHHEIVPGKHKCKLCDFRTFSRYALRNHRRTHEKVNQK